VTVPAPYRSRPARRADLDAVVALFKFTDRADAGVEDPQREHFEEEWRRPGFDLERHTLLVLGPDGGAVAFAQVFGFNPELSMDAHVRVHPAHRGRGIGSALVAWTERRAGEIVPEGVGSKLLNAVPAADDRAKRLFAGRGYEQVRIFWHMERELAAPVEEPRIPVGIEVRAYRHDVDADDVYDALEEAFADHWGFEPYPRDTHMDEVERLEPGLAQVALEGEEVVGVLLSRLVEGAGWVDAIGVRRPWRGRGIARALLLRSFAVLETRGASTVMLNVDSASETGATRLYASVGMKVRRAWHVFEKPLPAT
jgi:mycothiol synthase